MRESTTSLQKWTGLVCLLMAGAIIVAHYFYLTGTLDSKWGSFTYSLADFLYGTVWSAGLVMMVYTLRDRIGDRSHRLMTLALLLALAAACAFLTVASIRSANRSHLLARPDLGLQFSSSVLTAWMTLVSGVLGAAWHFLGWAFVLTGLAGFASRKLPLLLSGLYLVAGAASLAVYLLPRLEETALLLVVVTIIGQGVVLLAGRKESPTPDAKLV